MRTINIYTNNRTIPTVIEKGMTVSFDFYPNGQYTKPDKIQHVSSATLDNEEGRVITATYKRLGGLFGKQLVDQRVIVLRRLLMSGKDTYKVDQFVGMVDFNPEGR